MPLIKKYFDHFCFHTGGKAVIDQMQSLFSLDSEQIAASRASLYRYGNTSSASIWYELAYHECHGMKNGEIAW
jgi:3-ketoacyl-CoA synthase